MSGHCTAKPAQGQLPAPDATARDDQRGARWGEALRCACAPADALRRWLVTPGGDIGIRASTELTRSLIAARLVDHLRFVIPANIAGHGKRLFDADASDDLQRLKRVEVEQTPQGTLFIHYRAEPAG